MHNPEPVLENETHKLLRGFVQQMEHLISAKRPDLIIINKQKKKKENLQNSELCCPSWPQNKIGKKSEKKDNYLDLVKELKKLWNVKVTTVVGALGTVTKGFIKGLELLKIKGRVETIQTTALLRSARILRRVQETWGNLLSLKFQWKTIG